MFADLVMVVASQKQAVPDTESLFYTSSLLQQDKSVCKPLSGAWRQLYVTFVVCLSKPMIAFDTSS